VLGEALDASQQAQVPEAAEVVEGAEDKTQTEEAPVEDPHYDPFVLPEGLAFKDETLGEYTSLLAEFKAPQELGQKLVDMHVQQVQQAVESVNAHYQKHWQDTQQSWRQEILGAKDSQTVLSDAIGFLNAPFCGNETERAEFRQLMDKTGWGNNPVMVRFFARLGKQFLHEDSKAVPAGASAPQTKSRLDTLYGPG